MAPLSAAPQYDQGIDDLQWVLSRMIDWLPGEWSAFPHVHHNRTVRMPEAGEHDNWHRSVSLIDAPQIGGAAVFYAQVHIGDRNGPVIPRSQHLYKVTIDETRGAVVIAGQGPKDPERFLDLGERPELWSEVQMRDESAIRCDFLWRRSGDQVFGELEGRTPERRRYGPGTCAYISDTTQVEFFADAQWVLGPETWWYYDLNTMDGELFLGREDRTHTRYRRARPYRCVIEDSSGVRKLDGHDRGFRVAVAPPGDDDKELMLMLLRSEFPDEAQGRADELRLVLMEDYPLPVLAQTRVYPATERIGIEAHGISASCSLHEDFPRREKGIE
ncbi:MAG: hypothetical protein JJU27_16045 [Gammaproteobacteria bacterium]|nr:hypothetical protein [Gammaproteobacteria bacterium]